MEWDKTTYMYGGRRSTISIGDTKRTIFMYGYHIVGALVLALALAADLQIISFKKDFIPYFVGMVFPFGVLSFIVFELLGSFLLSDFLPIRNVQHVEYHVSAKNQLT